MSDYFIIFFILLWLILGVVGAGFSLAYFDTWGKDGFRQELGASLLLGILGGPIWLLFSFFMSGFGERGWRLWRKHEN